MMELRRSLSSSNHCDEDDREKQTPFSRRSPPQYVYSRGSFGRQAYRCPRLSHPPSYFDGPPIANRPYPLHLHDVSCTRMPPEARNEYDCSSYLIHSCYKSNRRHLDDGWERSRKSSYTGRPRDTAGRPSTVTPRATATMLFRTNRSVGPRVGSERVNPTSAAR